MRKLLAISAVLALLRVVVKPKIIYVPYSFGYNGFILPPFAVVINETQRDNVNLLAHELVHWLQYKRDGLLLFAARYAYHALIAGYDLNPMEIEARFNEDEYAKYNYTDAVRTGRAKTVYNPSFRS